MADSNSVLGSMERFGVEVQFVTRDDGTISITLVGIGPGHPDARETYLPLPADARWDMCGCGCDLDIEVREWLETIFSRGWANAMFERENELKLNWQKVSELAKEDPRSPIFLGAGPYADGEVEL